MSGARIMQIGSVLMLKGYDWLPRIIEGINQFLDDHRYPDLDAIHGIASKKAAAIYNDQFNAKKIHAVIDDEKCTRCWHRREDVGSVAAHASLCGRCADNIEGAGEIRRYA